MMAVMMVPMMAMPAAMKDEAAAAQRAERDRLGHGIDRHVHADRVVRRDRVDAVDRDQVLPDHEETGVEREVEVRRAASVVVDDELPVDVGLAVVVEMEQARRIGDGVVEGEDVAEPRLVRRFAALEALVPDVVVVGISDGVFPAGGVGVVEDDVSVPTGRGQGARRTPSRVGDH